MTSEMSTGATVNKLICFQEQDDYNHAAINTYELGTKGSVVL